MGWQRSFAVTPCAIAKNKVAMLLPMWFLEGVQRHDLFAGHPLKAIYIFSRRPKFGEHQDHQVTIRYLLGRMGQGIQGKTPDRMDSGLADRGRNRFTVLAANKLNLAHRNESHDRTRNQTSPGINKARNTASRSLIHQRQAQIPVFPRSSARRIRGTQGRYRRSRHPVRRDSG